MSCGWVEQATGLDPGRRSPRGRDASGPRVARQHGTDGGAKMAVRWALFDRERRCRSLGGLALVEQAYDPDRSRRSTEGLDRYRAQS